MKQLLILAQGYADTAQVGTGLRQRIYSRAFIVGDVNNPNNRWVYLVLDTANGDTAVRNGVLEGVAALGSSYSMYGSSNIALTGTHSHSGPGACKLICDFVLNSRIYPSRRNVPWRQKMKMNVWTTNE